MAAALEVPRRKQVETETIAPVDFIKESDIEPSSTMMKLNAYSTNS